MVNWKFTSILEFQRKKRSYSANTSTNIFCRMQLTLLGYVTTFVRTAAPLSGIVKWPWKGWQAARRISAA